MDFFTETDVPDGIEAKVKIEGKVESKYESSKGLETVAENLRLINGPFPTLSSHLEICKLEFV